jgi:hypothetical protein
LILLIIVTALQYGCFIAPLTVSAESDMAWWIDSNGDQQYYWTGSNSGSHICQCGLDDSCHNNKLQCNCDASLPNWFTDEGTLTDMQSLPVRQLNFGGLEFPSQQANFTLSSLQCNKGKKPFVTTESCESLQLAGHTSAGYYLTSGGAGDADSNHIAVTYCDLSLDPSESGLFQSDTLARLPKSFVAFDAYRTTTYSTANSVVIPYEAFQVNVGEGMSLASGVFTAPVAGVYSFSAFFLDNSATSYAIVRFRVNSVNVGSAHEATADASTVSMSLIVELSEGDKVDTYLDASAELFSTINRLIHFTGHLLYPTN